MAVQLASHVPQMASDDGVIDAAKKALGDALLDVKRACRRDHADGPARERSSRCCRALRDTPGLEYQQLMEIAGVDYPERAERFEVVYYLLSLTKNRRIRVKVTTDEATPVPSVTGAVAGRRLARARSVRHVRRRLQRQSRTCAGSSPITASRAIRSARTSRSPAMSSCAIRKPRSAWSMSRSRCRRTSAPSTS